MNRKKILFIIVILLSMQLIIAAQEDKSVAILFDISLSINADDFEILKASAISYIQHLQNNDIIALYGIGNEPKRVQEFTSNKEVIIQQINALQTSSQYTTLYDTLFFALNDLNLLGNGNPVIIAFSDGVDENSTLVFEDIIRELTNKGIPVFSVAAGKYPQGKRTLKRLSVLTKGKYFDQSAIDSDTISEIMNQKINEALPELMKQRQAIKSPSYKVPIEESLQKAPAVAKSEKSLKVEDLKEQEKQGKAGSSRTFIIITIALVVIALLLIIGLVIFLKRKKPERVCLKCGKTLEPFQLQCPDCQPEEIEEQEEFRIDPSLLKKTPIGEETIENTFVLIEKPVLIIRKGKMIGKKYYLSFHSPTTIGRS